MEYVRPLIHAFVLLGFCLSPAVAGAMPSVGGASGDSAPVSDVIPVGVDCYSTGQKVAEQNGGQLARAAPQNRGGRTVCVIVVLVPAKDGQRPRRVEFIVPAK
ncbi:MAG TPA: hypothetical protein VHC00_06830 [Rhizobiaceae bacterium]|jgi:hypothetical protein|nr:hypothetical protein [Rhizobiaceae bacterium]